MDNTKDYETIESKVEAEDFSSNESDAPVSQQQSNEASIPSEETSKLRAELEEQRDKYIRLFAEFDNFKRRSAKERIELIQTAGKDIIISLLQVLDDCDRLKNKCMKLMIRAK